MLKYLQRRNDCIVEGILKLWLGKVLPKAEIACDKLLDYAVKA